MSESPFTPDQLKEAGAQVQAPPIGTGPGTIDATGATATEVDVNALMARMAAMERQLQAALAANAPSGEHRLIADSKAARGLIAEHFDRGGRGNAADVLRLADDVVDAAQNSVASGDTGPARQVIAKLARALHAVHPGPGDNHYFTQALSIVEHGLPEAADSVTEAQPSNAPAVSGGAPARVIAGSVTG